MRQSAQAGLRLVEPSPTGLEEPAASYRKIASRRLLLLEIQRLR
jgi:hypothetical protein